jgi:hypothetical protein
MDMQLKDRFSERWKKYFPGAELPLAFWFSDSAEGTEKLTLPREHRCFLGDLAPVRQGRRPVRRYTIGCQGGMIYCGFSDKQMPDFVYFLSCGIPGKVRGGASRRPPAGEGVPGPAAAVSRRNSTSSSSG